MGKRRKAATVADKHRFTELQNLGCIVCGEFHGFYVEPAIHHIVDGYRLGHEYTIPLCAMHHQSIPPFGMSHRQALEKIGPAIHGQKVDFVAAYGTEMELLETTNRLLGIVA